MRRRDERPLSAREAEAVAGYVSGRLGYREAARRAGASLGVFPVVLARARARDRRHVRNRPEPPPGGWPKDLTGCAGFGRLSVTGPAGPGRWACSCSCGGSTVASRANLVGGGVRSCGCLLRENAKRTQAKATAAFLAKKRA